MTTNRTAALLLLIASTTGCSFALVNGPPSADLSEAYAERGIVPNCTKSYAIPILDLASGVVLVSLGAAVLADDSSEGNFGAGMGAGLGFLIGGVQLLSAGSGAGKVKRCRAFLEPQAGAGGLIPLTPPPAPAATRTPARRRSPGYTPPPP